MDSANFPCGVVSLSDLCRYLLSIPTEKYPKSQEHHKEKPKKHELHHLAGLVNDALESEEASEEKPAEEKKEKVEEVAEEKKEEAEEVAEKGKEKEAVAEEAK
jgi:hypothetical protein